MFENFADDIATLYTKHIREIVDSLLNKYTVLHDSLALIIDVRVYRTEGEDREKTSYNILLRFSELSETPSRLFEHSRVLGDYEFNNNYPKRLEVFNTKEEAEKYLTEREK